MNFSVSAPGPVTQYFTPVGKDGLERLSLDGGLLTFNTDGLDTLEAQVEAIRDMDAILAGMIADATAAKQIGVLGALKATVASFEPIVRREHVYKTRARAVTETAEATVEDTGSHLHAEQHTSTDNSSEQHGAVSDASEENVNVEKSEEGAEEQPRPRRSNRR